MSKEALKLALEALESNRRTHHYCEDTWYSCPKHEDGCANDSEGDECNCGADKANAGIDQAITAIKAALEAKDEPVAYINVEQRKLEWAKYMSWDTPTVVNLPKIPLYTTPPQRKPLTDEEIQDALLGYRLVDAIDIVRAIESAHGIKG